MTPNDASRIADKAFESYDFGGGVHVDAADGWESVSLGDKGYKMGRIVYVKYHDEAPDADTHKVSFSLDIDAQGAVIDHHALDMKTGNEIGRPGPAASQPMTTKKIGEPTARSAEIRVGIRDDVKGKLIEMKATSLEDAELQRVFDGVVLESFCVKHVQAARDAGLTIEQVMGEGFDEDLRLRVLQSNAGFYLGTTKDSMPYTRESTEYWDQKNKAEHAFATGAWTQRQAPGETIYGGRPVIPVPDEDGAAQPKL